MQKKRIIIITAILVLILITILTLILTQNKTNQVPKAIDETAEAQYTTQIGSDTFDITNAVEESPIPIISAGMIPVKWNGEYWQITTKDDKDWYDYSKGKPAYIMLNDGIYQSELLQDMTNKKLAEENIGAQILESDLRLNIYVDAKVCL